MAPLTNLQTEAAYLAQRSCGERTDYLFEVAHSAHRGPDEAERLRCLTNQLLGADHAPAPSDAERLSP